MVPSDYTAQVQAQCRDLVSRNSEYILPAQYLLNTGWTDEHSAAALWMKEHCGMRLEVYNLANMRFNWDRAVYAAAAKAKGDKVLGVSAPVEKGDFNPSDLERYLLQLSR
jgi:hypothetical protein